MANFLWVTRILSDEKLCPIKICPTLFCPIRYALNFTLAEVQVINGLLRLSVFTKNVSGAR